jgi:fatty acid desaturase
MTSASTSANGAVHQSPSAYAREIRGELSSGAFAPARSRLWFLPASIVSIAIATTLLGLHLIPWILAPLVSLFLGVCFASLTFVGHETLHGAIVRGALARRIVGFIGFLPFVISPRMWVAWHNRVHHGHANEAGIDPDAGATLDEYRNSRRVRVIIDRFALGRRSSTGVIGLLVGFTGQSLHVLSFAKKRGYLSARDYRFALAETGAGIAFWALIAWLVGPLAFLFAFGIPLVVANTIVMSFIFTNHSLSPLSEVNDPLMSALSVTAPRWIEWLTLGFGLHVEHHLFPSMSSRHLREVRELLRAKWPERYQSMPLWRALITLHRTARVYSAPTMLCDPRTGRAYPTLSTVVAG